MREDCITLPEAARRLEVTMYVIRRAVADRALPVIYQGEGWPKARVADVMALKPRLAGDLAQLAARRRAERARHAARTRWARPAAARHAKHAM